MTDLFKKISDVTGSFAKKAVGDIKVDKRVSGQFTPLSGLKTTFGTPTTPIVSPAPITSGAIDTKVSAADIGATKEVVVPKAEAPIATTAVDTTKDSVVGMLAGRQEEIKTQLEEISKSQQDVIDKLAGTIETQESKADLLRQQQEMFGIKETLEQTNALIAEASAIRKNIADLENQKNQEIIGMEERGGISMVKLTARQQLAERKWNSRIAAESAKLGAVAATIDALNGNLTRAQSFIRDAVNAAVYDQEQKVSNLKMFFDINKDVLDSLAKDEKDLFNKMIKEADEELKTLREEKNKVATLMLNYPSVGITLDTPYEQALAMAQPFKAQIIARKARADEALIKSRLDTGETARKLTEAERAGLAETIMNVIATGSREAAIASVNDTYGQLKALYGDEGLQAIVDEIERIYPEPIATPLSEVPLHLPSEKKKEASTTFEELAGSFFENTFAF